MLKKITKLSIIVTAIASINVAPAMAKDATGEYKNEQIRAVGSSTVYPFITIAAEEFGRKTKFKSPIIESTGSGGGLKLFCSGVGNTFPDIANSSRAIKESEVKLCASNSVKNINEIKIGFDGIVLANSTSEKQFRLTKKEIFLALGSKIPVDGKLIKNTYKKWSEINPALPDSKIEVYGPPPTSGTRDAFVELVLGKACVNLPEFKKAYPNKKNRKKACHHIREDGHFIEAGENDNLIVQKLKSNPKALGMFGFSFLDNNSSVIQGTIVEGKEPTFENISDGSYSLCRLLYVYLKGDHINHRKGLKEFASELVSNNAIGEDGYLIDKGLIPLPEKDLEKMQKLAKDLK